MLAPCGNRMHDLLRNTQVFSPRTAPNRQIAQNSAYT
jgi:hypothetical protein